MGRKFWYRHEQTDGEWVRSRHEVSFGSEVAERVAEHLFNDDPVRPDMFTAEVWVKDEFGWEGRFLVTAEATINFTATDDTPRETTRNAVEVEQCPEPNCDLIRGHTENHEADWTTQDDKEPTK